MKKAHLISLILAQAVVLNAPAAEITDIRQKCCTFLGGLVGPGSIKIKTDGGPQISVGADATLAPVHESNWDFGFSDFAAGGIGGVAGTPAAGSDFYATHISEAGDVIGGDYFRNQLNLYFNVLPDDEAWSFFMQLQYDQANDISNLDAGGGAGVQSSDLGLERLNISSKVPWSSHQRIHAGFDLYDADTIEGAGLIFGDDSAGVWLTGDPSDDIHYNVSYHFINDGNIANNNFSFANADDHDDRDAIIAYLDWKNKPGSKFRFIYGYDHIESAAVVEQNAVFLGMASGLGTGLGTVAGTNPNGSDAGIHNFGAYWKGTINNFELFAEGVYKYGDVDNAGLSNVVVDLNGNTGRDNYDVRAYALAGYIKTSITDKLSARVSVMYTSGDDDASDGELGGYNAIISDQRFSGWGHMTSFLGNGNFLLGIPVFSHLPEALGNGTPINTGGVANFRNTGGAGRGDNPGFMSLTFHGDYAFNPTLNFHTRVNLFGWNEDFVVNNVVNTSPGFNTRNVVSSGYAGTEWGNEISWRLNKNTSLLFHGSLLFPGEGIENITRASGAETDEVTTRIGAAMLFAF